MQLVWSRIVLFLAAAAGCALAWAGTGAPDATFGTAGRTYTNLGTGAASYGVTSMALQADGKIVVVANQFLLSRYNADGTLDASFNGSGRVQLPYGMAFAVALQSDGKIVVAGAGVGYAAMRFNSDGTPDSGFGNNGSASVMVGVGGAPYDVRVQADGKILMAGVATTTPSYKTAFGVARLNANGSSDTTFNGTGTLVAPIGAEGDVARTLALQPDGRIVLAGRSSLAGGPGFALMRLLQDGSSDPSFGSGGIATTSFPAPGSGGAYFFPAELRSVTIQPDGKIVAAGLVNGISANGLQSPVLARYHPDGTLDTTFNGAGYAVTPLVFGFDYAYASITGVSLARQADGALVIATVDGAGGVQPCAGARYLPDGSLDTSFNGSGVWRGGTSCSLLANAVQPDGRIISGGLSGDRLVLFRHLANGSIDTGFGTGGRVLDQISFTPDVATAIALQADGRIVTAGQYFGLGSGLVLTRHSAAGVLDPSFGNGGIARRIYTVSMTLGATAIDAAGSILTAGSYYTPCAGHTCIGPTTLVVARWNPDGTGDGAFGWATGPANSAGGSSNLRFNSIANAIALQPDGKIVVAGSTDNSQIFSSQPSYFAVVRFTSAGAADTSFNGTGALVAQLGENDRAHALALHADGRIVVVGRSKSGTQYDLAIARLTAGGGVESTARWDVGGDTDDAGLAVLVQPDGKIVVGGSSGAQGFIARFTAPGTHDTSFATSGKRLVADSIVSMALQPDGKILALTSAFQLLRFLPSGEPDATFGSGGRVAVAMPAGATASALAIQPDGRVVIAGSANPGLSQDFALVRIDPAGAASMAASPDALNFAGQSMNTTSASRVVTITNTTSSALTVQSVTASTGYTVVAHDCAGLAAAATCTATVTFTPPVEGAAPGVLTVLAGTAAIGVPLEGLGERSLVSHYYRSILRRDPDAGGKDFWTAEAARAQALGLNVNEAWFAMAQAFYFSAEYAAQGRDNTGFITDVYNTFYARAPDSGGLAFWVNNLATGMPREVALAEFMFSAEFRGFSQAIFGNPAVRAEVNAVTDFYRGLLARLPDNAGFAGWVANFRAAQCQGSAAVVAQVEAISRAFVDSPEYAARGRSAAQYVGDLYNAFLRRGGDLGGVQFWIGQVTSGARSRDQVRQAFRDSAEFQGRVSAIIAQGCIP